MTEEEAGKLAEECGGENAYGDLFYMTATQLAMFADSARATKDRDAEIEVLEELAKLAGFDVVLDLDRPYIIGPGYTAKNCATQLAKFAELAVAKERESCAKLCEAMARRCQDIRKAALEMAAESIRLRNNA